jgi:uncharacterized metal-binding protein
MEACSGSHHIAALGHDVALQLQQLADEVIE